MIFILPPPNLTKGSISCLSVHLVLPRQAFTSSSRTLPPSISRGARFCRISLISPRQHNRTGFAAASSTSCTCSCAGPIVEPLSRTFHAQSIVGTSQLASLSLSLELRAFLSHWLEVWFSVQTFGFPVNRHQERTTVSFDLDFSASMACEKETLSHQQLPLSSPYRRLCNFVSRKLINLRAQFIGQIFH